MRSCWTFLLLVRRCLLESGERVRRDGMKKMSEEKARKGERGKGELIDGMLYSMDRWTLTASILSLSHHNKRQEDKGPSFDPSNSSFPGPSTAMEDSVGTVLRLMEYRWNVIRRDGSGERAKRLKTRRMIRPLINSHVGRCCKCSCAYISNGKTPLLRSIPF